MSLTGVVVRVDARNERRILGCLFGWAPAVDRVEISEWHFAGPVLGIGDVNTSRFSLRAAPGADFGRVNFGFFFLDRP
jgi:hypothetical protein